MRFSTDIIFKGDPPFRVPTNYRIKIASLIKGSIKDQNSDLFRELWGQNKTKPFTFCTYMYDAKHIKENDTAYLEFTGGKMGLTMSSSDPGILINIYNALVNYSGEQSPFGYSISLRNFRLAKEPAFHDRRQTFRLMSPMVIRNMTGEGKKKKDNGYLPYDDPRFSENLYHEVRKMCIEFIDKSYNLEENDFIFTPVECRAVKIIHYGEVITAVSGTFTLGATTEVLKLVYDAGIGSRRSQGFGMLEIVG